MKTKTLLFLFLVLGVVGVAFGNTPPPSPPTSEPAIINTTESSANASAVSQNTNTVTGEGGAGTATASNDGVQVNTSINTPRQRSRIKVQTVPGGQAPNIYSANPCVISSSARLALAMGSASRGKQKVDKGCEVRDLIRLAYAGNDSAIAIHLMCNEAVRLEQFDNHNDCMELRGVEVPDVIVHVNVSDGQQHCKLRAVGQTVVKEYTSDGVQVVYECQEMAKGS